MMSPESETDAKVLSILDDIKNNRQSEDKPTKESSKTTPKAKQENNAIRGIPKSGRFWKSKKERFNTVVKTKGIRLDFEKKTALRIELQRIKDLSRQITAQINEKQQGRKERRRENLRRAQENKMKSEVVQVITNTKKLKRLKKKQLRFIEKRDTNTTVSANKSE